MKCLGASILIWAVLLGAAQKIPAYVTASFVDKNRLYVEDLSKEEIRLYENGRQREVEFLAGTEIPAAYGLLFDRTLLPLPYDEPRRDAYTVSAPTAGRSVAYQLLDLVLGRHVGWAATYDDKELRIALDFSQDPSRIKDAIELMRGQHTQEESWLYGPLFSAVQKMAQRHEKRRVLVVFIHTLDLKTADRLKPLKNLLSASNVELFVAGFAPRTRSGTGLLPAQSEASLRELTSVTAGSAYFSNLEGLEQLGRRIADQIRTFYTIGFESESSSAQQGRLTIECTRPGVKVKTHPVVPLLQ